MATCLFLTTDLVDLATLTASSEVSTLPVTNLQKKQPARVYRSGNKTPTITIQLATSYACNALALVGHNAAAAATWQFRGATSQANLTAAPTVNSGSVSMWPASGKPDTDYAYGFPYLSSLVLVTNSTPLTWWSIAITDSTNSDNFQAGRLMLGRAVRPTMTMSINGGIQPFSAGEQRMSDFNEMTLEERGVNGRRLLLPFGSIDKTDFHQYILPFAMKHGKAKDFFFSMEPTATTEFLAYSGQFVFEDPPAFERQRAWNQNGAKWASSMALKEVT